MIISHAKIIGSIKKFNQLPDILYILAQNTVIYKINQKIHGCREIPELFLVLSMIFKRSK